MQKVHVEQFDVIGIATTTTNQEGKSTQDIGQLWGRFMSEGIKEKIPNKVSNDVFSIYTNYQGDHTKPYDTILGCKVNSLDEIPEGMIGQSFNGGEYGKLVAKGDLTKGVVFGTWNEIYDMNLNREFTADFERYDENMQDPTNAEVEVFVAIK